MEPVTSTTHHSTERRQKAGFTLVELLVTMIVLSLISSAVFSAFLFFNKTGINIGNYVDMDRQSRLGLEKFAIDARMAGDISWTSNTELTLLSVPIDAAGNTYDVSYKFIPSSDPNATLRRTFARRVTNSGNTSVVPNDTDFVPLISNVVSTTFRRYNVGSPTGATASSPTIPQAGNDLETKQINIDLVTERQSALVARATNVVLSARYVLRNKVVVN